MDSLFKNIISIASVLLLVFLFSCQKGNEPIPYSDGLKSDSSVETVLRKGDIEHEDNQYSKDDSDDDSSSNNNGVIGGDDNEDDDDGSIIGGDDNEDDDVVGAGVGSGFGMGGDNNNNGGSRGNSVDDNGGR